LLRLLLVVRVVVFIVIIVVEMDMWWHLVTGRRKFRSFRLVIFYWVPVALVLKDLRGILLV
jgi:hypothetical protein